MIVMEAVCCEAVGGKLGGSLSVGGVKLNDHSFNSIILNKSPTHTVFYYYYYYYYYLLLVVIIIKKSSLK